MPVNETAVIPTSFIGRISACTSLISARDYKTIVQLLDNNETICQEFKVVFNNITIKLETNLYTDEVFDQIGSISFVNAGEALANIQFRRKRKY
ncbi:hypothetical protein QQG55_53850 [Brugia pahangi]